jgi:hypothetical protein
MRRFADFAPMPALEPFAEVIGELQMVKNIVHN